MRRSRPWQQDSIAACSERPAHAARCTYTPDWVLELKVAQASADRQTCGRVPIVCRADNSPTSAGHKTLVGEMPKHHSGQTLALCLHQGRWSPADCQSSRLLLQQVCVRKQFTCNGASRLALLLTAARPIRSQVKSGSFSAQTKRSQTARSHVLSAHFTNSTWPPAASILSRSAGRSGL